MFSSVHDALALLDRRDFYIHPGLTVTTCTMTEVRLGHEHRPWTAWILL